MTQQDLKEALKQAMMAKDAVRLAVIRGVMATATNEAITLGRGPAGVLEESELEAVIRRGIKQRKDSIEQFIAGGREDLADSEKAELAVLESFVPALMTAEEIEALVKEKLAASPVDASGKNQFMGMLMKELKGKADGSVVKEVVEKLLA